MMGKTQRFSKGHSSGFVPEYRHAVETVGESEGFGSSGRVDSEDSSAPKRKCINLNMESRNVFNVPSQVLSMSRMSKSQRKEVEMRLRGELEQVQFLQKNLFSRNVTSDNKGALSSSSSRQLKNHNRTSQNGPNLKKSNSERFESLKQIPQPPPVVNKQNSHALLMKQCENILKQLLAHKFSWVFKEPVDIVKLNIPDYFKVIKHPMDLGTIRSRLTSGSYSSPLGFASDVRLTFTNAMTYNPPSNDVHFMADSLSKIFESKWKHIEKKLVSADAAAKRQIENLKPVAQTKKRKASPVFQDTIRPEKIKSKMTEEEKVNLGRCLESFPDMPDVFVDFFRSHTNNLNQTIEDEIEIDMDALSDDTLFELKKLVDDYSRGRQTGHQSNAEPCEVEILNESGLSNSSMHAGKGNEHADEEVDIGGNDPPVLSYPPVVINKDALLRSGKHSSSSSSSSDSGSSSDSDSSSSSGGESDIKVSPQKDNKGSLPSGTDLIEERSEKNSHMNQNKSSNALDQLEQSAYAKPESVESEHSKEGENAPSERQVSPEKLHRAALLRSRFADTILKAREKTLDQVEKKDPEKFSQEKEELERQQREEKARLKAEAKVAEDARKQAEAEAAAQAAAEARRKRELEREAARQALLQMEKTVEINESGRFLKDLEMLRTAPADHLPSSVGETSPAHSHEGIGGFDLGVSNPLEQLGLYMKADDDEEEDVEHTLYPINDVEDGEID